MVLLIQMKRLKKENLEDKDIVTLELNILGRIIGPKIPPNTLPPSKVRHPKAGIGHLQPERSIMDDDIFACYEFPEDPKAYFVTYGPNKGKRYPSLYDIFLL